MPIPMVLTSSDGFTGGQKYTRFGGPVYSGTVADGSIGGPLPAPGALALIQSTSPIRNQIISTAAAGRAAYVYIPQAVGTFVPDAEAPPYTGHGVALVWDAGDRTLNVYSSISGAWLRLHSTTGAELMFSSS